MENTQTKFIKQELYILSWNASVQHNKIYNTECSASERSKFRKDIIDYIDSNIMPKYNSVLSEDAHYDNINLVKKYAEQIGLDVLSNKKYKIGTAQKLLNLSLKYFWCANWIKEPPHCPVDKIILDKVGIKLSWTKIDSIEEYRRIINEMRVKINRNDLAKWELEIYSRR